MQPSRRKNKSFQLDQGSHLRPLESQQVPELETSVPELATSVGPNIDHRCTLGNKMK